jgi:hypothetical protein
MSYCRWGADSDVYVYEDCAGGWTTHVCNRRKKAEFSPTQDTTIKDFMDGYAEIGLPSDGGDYYDETPTQCADRLELLRNEGYIVPQYAIDSLREEAKEAPQG